MEYPKIDYLYWRDAYEKTITGSKPNKRVQNSLDRIRSIILKDYPEKSNNKLALLLRRPNLEDRDMSKIKQLADEIADEILDESNEDIKELKYLTIFDAINAWGGISARGMYVQEIKEYFWHLVIELDGKKDKLFNKEFINKYNSIIEQKSIL